MLSYRSILKEELARRCQANAMYSQRAFARDLGLSSARLSEVLAGRYGLSRKAAEMISKKLGFQKREAEDFCDLVESEHARSRIAKSAAMARLESRKEPLRLQMDAFAVIADWYHFAILELTELKGFKSDVKWMARSLGVHESVVEVAIGRLKRLELLEEHNGKLCPTEDTTFSPDGTPSEAIKKFHKQVLEKASQALYLQSVEEREYGASILAINSKKLPEAKKAIKEFRRKFCQDVGQGEPKDDVYCLSVQFFNLTQVSKETKK